jgi:plasmid stabilization system protein ParE
LSGYTLSADASQDLDEIFDYVWAQRPDAAHALLDDIESALRRLADLPRAGRVRLDLATSDVRFWVVRGYVIIYRAEVSPIDVLRVVSGNRDLGEVLPWQVSEDVELATAYA